MNLNLIQLTSPKAGAFWVNVDHITAIFPCDTHNAARADVYLTGSQGWSCLETVDSIHNKILELEDD